jgi:hypothetical protein
MEFLGREATLNMTYLNVLLLFLPLSFIENIIVHETNELWEVN